MDPCEYEFNQHMIMRRLLSFLRQTQSTCSDIECYNDFPGQREPATATPENFMMMTVACVVMGVLLFMTRPTQSRNSYSDAKPSSDRSGPDNNPDPSQSAN